MPTIDRSTIRPIGTKTVTCSDRQVMVPGRRSTPSFASAPKPRTARTSAAPSELSLPFPFFEATRSRRASHARYLGAGRFMAALHE